MTVTPTGDPFPLGPGELKLGQTGTELDVSCLVNGATITADKNEGDSTTKLCGTVRPGAITYDYHLDGNVDTDIAESTGLFAMSQAQAGQQIPFSYTPSTDAGTVATGSLVLDPLDFGGDTTGETMTSDFSFTIVGPPTYTYGGATGLEADTVADTSDQPELVDA